MLESVKEYEERYMLIIKLEFYFFGDVQNETLSMHVKWILQATLTLNVWVVYAYMHCARWHIILFIPAYVLHMPCTHKSSCRSRKVNVSSHFVFGHIFRWFCLSLIYLIEWYQINICQGNLVWNLRKIMLALAIADI